MKKLFTLVVVATVVLFIAGGCSKTTVDWPDSGTGAAPNSSDNVMSLQTSRFETKAELRDYIASKITCPQHDLDLLTDEKFNPDCAVRRQILVVVDKMINSGWTLEEIESAIPLIKQGKNPFIELRNQKSCGSPDKIKLDFFLMSHCPYGTRYEEQILPPLLDDFGEALEWQPHYIVNINSSGDMVAMHGAPELDENKFQICISRDVGNEAWLSYTKCYAGEFNIANNTARKKGARLQEADYLKIRNVCSKKTMLNTARVNKCVANKADEYLKQDKILADRWQSTASPTSIYNCNLKVSGAIPYVKNKPHLCTLLSPENMPEACK
ncbi:MAG TPA: hypothetical protein PLN69_10265 [bacterium]|nr:hypothetical protein [bacterium]